MIALDSYRWGSAVHEVGHVVAALVLGVPVERATLDETTFRGKASARVCGLIAVAGACAAREAGCLLFGGLSVSDRSAFSDCGLSLGNAMLEARRILRADWRGVIVLAESLYNSRRGELDGDDARFLFDWSRWAVG